ncbi:MAG: hypothetical protein ACYTFY_14170 [Planctomycetota bacterium]
MRKKTTEKYRAVSWWFTWEDLLWPDKFIEQKFIDRADKAQESAVNCAVIFGTHFRWDFMPLWPRLHDMFAFVAEELHKRKIMLFDHHSSVLVHRPRNAEERRETWRRNRHHVPFYPSPADAENLTCKGSRLNDWRMIDFNTGKAAYLRQYTAEQFCMNNPDFRSRYLDYVKLLLKETNIDGLMSDDGIFYPGWNACGCEVCRRKFRKEFGHNIPSVKNLNFWGNYASSAFKDFITFRFNTAAEHLEAVKAVLPENFPLMACCSSSDNYKAARNGLSYQSMVKACNHIMLEMCGSTPSLDGTWNNRSSAQLLHLGLAEDNNAPCFGLGYGFFEDPAFFVWAVNKFLGSDTWFSTLKGRLGLSEAESKRLPDDSELVGEGFRFEKENPQLFCGKPSSAVKVLFSRNTRDYYNEVPDDYAADYTGTCNALMNAGFDFGVITEIPEKGRGKVLVLSAVICLASEEEERLQKFISSGGTVIASGPLGVRDSFGRRRKKSFAEDLGIRLSVKDPARKGFYPPFKDGRKLALMTCSFSGAEKKMTHLCLEKGKGRVLFFPDRINVQDTKCFLQEVKRILPAEDFKICNLPNNWFVRKHLSGKRILYHALPASVGVRLHRSLKNQFTEEAVLEKIKYREIRTAKTVLVSDKAPVKVMVHSPDLKKSRIMKSVRKPSGRYETRLNLKGIKRYFTIEVNSK